MGRLIDLDDAINAMMELQNDDIESYGCLIPEGFDGDRAVEKLMALPSAQPEIIHCRDCKYWHREIHNGIEYFNFSSCDLNHYGDGHNFYCADAERREE